jgi:hypothetical protein
VFATIQQDASYMFPEEYERVYAQRIQSIMNDPILSSDGYERINGDSQLRPRTLYP